MDCSTPVGGGIILALTLIAVAAVFGVALLTGYHTTLAGRYLVRWWLRVSGQS